MAEQNPKKRHHYIPVFYLNGFTNQGGCLWVYDKDDKPMFESSPVGIAYENHYFSFVTPQGEKDSETVEDMIMQLEGEFAKVVKKICNSEKLTDDDRVTFAYFVASMMVRVPNFRNNIQKSMGEMIKHTAVFTASLKEGFEQMVADYIKEKGADIGMSVEEFRQKMLDKDSYDITVDSQYAMGMALSQLDSMARVFFKMKWAFMRATNDFKFMAGDNPLKYIDPTHDHRSFYGVGLANENIEVSLPLSKEVCAFGSWRHKDGYMQATNQHVKHLNKMTVVASVKFVFADKRSDGIDKFVKKYKGSHPVMVVG